MSLRDKYIEPPFSVLNTCTASWKARKANWNALGIESWKGRPVLGGKSTTRWLVSKEEEATYSVFDPCLCEVAYRWFAPDGGSILDPFCGGSVRGIVAGYLGYSYLGIDIRKEQIDENVSQRDAILGDSGVEYVCGDSNTELDSISKRFDLVFTCPPYYNLEIYSDLENDLSAMDTYGMFMSSYRSIIRKSCSKLKKGGFACVVVSELRSLNGFLRGFVPDTIKAFTDAGMWYYNEIVVITSAYGASVRANQSMKTNKVARVHQTMLVFKK